MWNKVSSLLTLLIILLLATSSTVSAHSYSIAFTKIELSYDRTVIQFAIDDLSVLESIEGIDVNGDYFLDQEEVAASKEKILEWMNQHFILEINEKNINLRESELSLKKELPNKDQFQLGEDLKYDEIMVPDNSVVIATLHLPQLNEGDLVYLQDTFYVDSPGSENYVNFLNISNHGEVQTTTSLFGNQRTYSFQVGNVGMDASPVENKTQKNIVDWKRFLLLGSEHILFGYDHLLFLFTLILLKMRVREYIKIITSFTIAHSITLGMAVSGALSLPSKLVEPMIALSIIYVTVENIFFSENAKHRWWITFLFGLVHGLGFAEILIRMNLPKSQFIQSLLSFNLGIEIMQVILVLVIFPFLWKWQQTQWYPKTFKLLNVFGMTAGFIWLFQRLF